MRLNLEPAGLNLFCAIMSLLALPLALSSSNASLFGLLVLSLLFGSSIPMGSEFLIVFVFVFCPSPFVLWSYCPFGRKMLIMVWLS